MVFVMVETKTKECDYDGGDCIEFNTNHPNCIVDGPSAMFGDDSCDLSLSYFTIECG